MSRRQAREAALQALYQLDVNPGGAIPTEVQEQQALDAAFMESEEGLSKKTRSYAAALVRGTREFQDRIDEAIQMASSNWKVSRMAVIDRNIARLATYEMTYLDPPLEPKIAIDEAVELAKKYGADESPRFLNGLLDAMAKK